MDEVLSRIFLEVEYIMLGDININMLNPKLKETRTFLDIVKDDRINCLNNMISALFNFHAPLQLVTLKRKKSPYIIPTVKIMSKLKKKAYRKYLKTRSNSSREHYVDIRNLLEKAIKSERAAYMKFEIRKCKNDSKQKWKKLIEWDINSGSHSGDHGLSHLGWDVNELN
ncbi:hypothetical protein HHI36_011089 [Cryptolaemus montrouzieri]|uniref:Uncharacterized protein n=1 Tax=Cryptolaemus montrouzieri TaxID=559131 RepID=A0ABD2MKT7_9CUCU